MSIQWFLLSLTLLTACEKEVPTETVRPVKAIRVEGSPAAGGEILFPGTLRAFQHADISFRVDGIIVEREISVGQRVKKNEILIRLDSKEYQIALAKATGKVASTRAQLDFALRDYERMKKIYETDPGAISVSFLDRKLETGNQLKAELTIAEGDLEKASDDLSYTTLKAPFDGIIAATYVENHEQVRAKQAAVRLISAGDREMEISVPEKYINTLVDGEAGLSFTIRLDAFPDKVFPAVIKEIGPEASSTTQTYPVTLTLKGISFEPSLLPGMSGRAVLQLPKSVSGLNFQIPKSAVSIDYLNRSFVWVVDPKALTVTKKTVRLDTKMKGNFAVITEGLQAGDWVVTGGASFLSEGQKVKFAAENAGP